MNKQSCEIGWWDVKVSGETVGDLVLLAENVLCEEGGVVSKHGASESSIYFVVEVALD